MLIFSFFWATFGGIMGTTRAPNDLGPPNLTKKLAHWVDLFGQPLSRNHVFEIFRWTLSPLTFRFKTMIKVVFQGWTPSPFVFPEAASSRVVYAMKGLVSEIWKLYYYMCIRLLTNIIWLVLKDFPCTSITFYILRLSAKDKELIS